MPHSDDTETQMLGLPSSIVPYVDKDRSIKYLSSKLYEIPLSLVDDYLDDGWVTESNYSGGTTPDPLVSKPDYGDSFDLGDGKTMSTVTVRVAGDGVKNRFDIPHNLGKVPNIVNIWGVSRGVSTDVWEDESSRDSTTVVAVCSAPPADTSGSRTHKFGMMAVSD